MPKQQGFRASPPSFVIKESAVRIRASALVICRDFLHFCRLPRRRPNTSRTPVVVALVGQTANTQRRWTAVAEHERRHSSPRGTAWSARPRTPLVRDRLGRSPKRDTVCSERTGSDGHSSPSRPSFRGHTNSSPASARMRAPLLSGRASSSCEQRRCTFSPRCAVPACRRPASRPGSRRRAGSRPPSRR
jgi:hypothetical protein